MRIDPAFWAGRQVVLTGHTGFKGAWLTLWLQRLGAQVGALALMPDTVPSLYALAAIRPEREIIADLREPQPIADLLAAARPTWSSIWQRKRWCGAPMRIRSALSQPM